MTQDEIISLARGLMVQHGLVSWSFRFDSHKRRFGVCNYREKYIGVSWPVARLNSDADIIDTIKHEIAHALTPGADHGRMWKLAAMACGARPETCAATHVKTPPGRWQYHCPCGIEYNRYKQPRHDLRYRCCQCHRGVIWTDTRPETQTRTPSVSELYAAVSV